jgi:cell division protein FtsZ
MIQVGIPSVDFITVNTDAQALARSEAALKIQLGERFTRGLGAGGDPTIGAEAAERSREGLAAGLRGADMVFIAAGMGGGTGSGAAPVVAQIAREQGALTIAVVTKPFAFEGGRRHAVAEAGIKRLEEEVDTLVVVSNDRLLHLVNERVSLDIAFRIADEVLRQGIQGISELVTQPGLVNLDFADVRSVMDRAGGALVSIGYGEGRDKALEAARVALASPLLDIESVNGTDGLLVNVTGGDDLTLAEVNEAMEIISRAAMPHAQILFGAVIDPKMEGRVQITLIATGLGIGKVSTVPAKTEGVSLPFDPSDLFGDDLAVPAFMRSPAQSQAMWRT